MSCEDQLGFLVPFESGQRRIGKSTFRGQGRPASRRVRQRNCALGRTGRSKAAWAVLRIESSQSNARRKKFLQSTGSITDFTLAPLDALSASHETRVDRRRRLRGRRWLYGNDRD